MVAEFQQFAFDPLVSPAVVLGGEPLAAAHRAIDQLRREGRTVNYAAVAHAAGVSRAWLYRQDQIRDLISQLRDHKPPPAAQHASTDSLRQRLDTARAEITRLRAENRSLRDQLGLQRTQQRKPFGGYGVDTPKRA